MAAVTEHEFEKLLRYGFCLLRDAATPVMAQLHAAFDTLLPDAPQTPTQRVTRFHAADHDERMKSIMQTPAVMRLLARARTTCLVSSDVNVLVGDSFWHSDGFYDDGLYLRVVVYGEPLDASNGALRVIPASHRSDSGWGGESVRLLMQHDTALKLGGQQIPAVTIPSTPGDVVVFNTNILHSAWGGGRRRQWAWNFARPPATDAERRAISRYVLNRFVSGSVRFS